MSVLLVNGRHAYAGELRFPRVGAWEGDVQLPREGDLEVDGQVTLELGSSSWVGSAWRSGENKGSLHVRLVGGAGGLSSMLAPKSYENVPARIPVQDILGEVGETLSATADAELLSRNLPKWTRAAQPAGLALANLVAQLGGTWRIAPDGAVWIGTESWSASLLEDFQYLQRSPAVGSVDLVAVDPVVFPGELFLERRVSMVTHRAVAGEVWTRVLWEEDGEAEDRMKAALRALVRAAVPHLDYLAGYWCRVVGQNADGTLELLPDDQRLAGHSHVPIRPGLAGASVKVPAGSRVLLEFAGGDPTKPIATVWESANPTEITLGVGTSQPATLATALRTELDAIWAQLAAHGHPCSVDGTSHAGATTGTTGVSKTAQPIASSTVRVKV